MDTDRREPWTHAFTDRGALSRRGLSGLAAGATAALALAVNAGAKKKKKKKKKKTTCPTPTTPTCQVACPAGANVCLDNPAWFCGLDRACATGTSRTIRGKRVSTTCESCVVDADCDSKTGSGSVCLLEEGGCSCNGLPRACMPPCANLIPIQCS